MTLKQSLTTGLLVAATAIGSIWGYDKLQEHNGTTEWTDNGLFKTASYVETPLIDPGVDFEKAATKAVPAVVHIKTVSKAKQVAVPRTENNPFRDFFGDGFEVHRCSTLPHQVRHEISKPDLIRPFMDVPCFDDHIDIHFGYCAIRNECCRQPVL